MGAGWISRRLGRVAKRAPGGANNYKLKVKQIFTDHVALLWVGGTDLQEVRTSCTQRDFIWNKTGGTVEMATLQAAGQGGSNYFAIRNKWSFGYPSIPPCSKQPGIDWSLIVKFLIIIDKWHFQGYSHWARRYSGALGPLGRGHCMALRSEQNPPCFYIILFLSYISLQGGWKMGRI